MSDRYQQLVNTPIGKVVSKQIGLPAPVRLERYERGRPVVTGPVLFGAAPGGRLSPAVARVLGNVGAEVRTPLDEEVRSAAADAGLGAGVFNPETASEEDTFKALVFDATGIADSSQLREAFTFFHPTIRRVRSSGAGDQSAELTATGQPALVYHSSSVNVEPIIQATLASAAGGGTMGTSPTPRTP